MRVAVRLALGLLCLSLALGCSSNAPADFAASASVGNAIDLAVVGGDERGQETASQFRSGCGLGCQGQPTRPDCGCFRSVLHAPRSWRTTQLHLAAHDLYYDRTYWDETVADTQKERDTGPDGLEAGRVVFYAGEGKVGSFDAFLAKKVPLGKLSLGDRGVRYLLMMSCNLFAHGPKEKVQGSVADFSAPWKFDPEAIRAHPGEPSYGVNAFSTWGGIYDAKRSPLNPRLRLACGGSSRIGGEEYPTAGFWRYFSVAGLGPAESFLVGVSGFRPGDVPLCMSRGTSDSESSGLFDPYFETDTLVPKPDKPGALTDIYLEYPRLMPASDPLAQALQVQGVSYSDLRLDDMGEPPQLPVLELAAAPVPAFLATPQATDGPALRYGYRGGSAKAIGVDLDFLASTAWKAAVSPEDVCIARHEGSGSLALSWRPLGVPAVWSGKAGWQALGLVGVKAIESLLAPPVGAPPSIGSIAWHKLTVMRTAINGVPADPRGLDQLTAQLIRPEEKCAYVKVDSVYQPAAGDAIPIFGEGAEAVLAVCRARAPQESDSTLATAPACERRLTPRFSILLGNRRLTGIREAPQIGVAAAGARGDAMLAARGLSASYHLVRTRWGYRSAPSHCKQDEMFLAYELDYAPSTPNITSDLTIEVPAHELPGGRQTIEETIDCSPEVPGGD